MSGILSIAMSGLNDATLRLSNAASNIANASSTSRLPAQGGSYTGFLPQDVVTLSAEAGEAAAGATSTLRPRTPSYLPSADPSASAADANGLVAMPNVDMGSELIAAKAAQFSYSANVALIRTDDQMQKSLLDALV